MNISEIIDSLLERLRQRLNTFKTASIILFGTDVVETFYCYVKDGNVWKISCLGASSKPFGEIKALHPMSNLSTDADIQALAAAISLDF